MERAVISARKRKSFTIDFEDVSIDSALSDCNYRLKKLEATFPSNFSELSPKSFKEFSESLEKEYFTSALELADGNIEILATAIGIGRSTAFKKMRELGISVERTRTTQAKWSESTNKERSV